MTFMLGARNWKVLRALSPYGFDDDEIVEGWARFQRFTSLKLDHQPVLVDPTLLAALDRWENHWYPIIEVVLRTRFPRVHEFVFRNLKQSEGPEVIVTVSTVLNRLDQVERPEPEGGFGEEGQAARAMLVKRGLTETVIAEPLAILAQLGKPAEQPLVDEPESSAEAKAAEDHLWAWYLEWSTIARSAIHDRRLLRLLGFLRTVRTADGKEVEVIVEDEVEDEEIEEEQPEPAPTPTPTPNPADPDPTEV